MTNEEALAFLNGETSIDSKSTQDGEKKEEIATSVNNKPSTDGSDKATDQGTENKTNSNSESKVETASKSPEKTSEDIVSKNKDKDKAFTDKWNKEKSLHAFSQERSKRKAAQAEFESKLASKQKEIDDLKALLEKSKRIGKAAFKGNDEAYLDYKVDQKFNAEKVKRMEEDMANKKAEFSNKNNDEIMLERMDNCFGKDSDEEKQYVQVAQKAITNFEELHPGIGYKTFYDFMNSDKDKEQTIWKYLNDSEYAPKLIRHFIYKPESAEKIMNMHSPMMKVIAMKELENRMRLYDKAHKTLPKTATTTSNNKSLPAIGKQVGSKQNPDNSNEPKSMKYWMDYLNKH